MRVKEGEDEEQKRRQSGEHRLHTIAAHIVAIATASGLMRELRVDDIAIQRDPEGSKDGEEEGGNSGSEEGVTGNEGETEERRSVFSRFRESFPSPRASKSSTDASSRKKKSKKDAK